MFQARFTTRLAILAIPMMLSVAGVEVAWAQAGSVRADDRPCRNAVLSLAPISLCRATPP
jgi:hypothetical protein